jgi:adenylyl cyclase-associated protein
VTCWFVLQQVKGKCNAISIDKCTKTGVVFEDVIASCELVNCNSVQVRLFVGDSWSCCCCFAVG